MTQRGLQRTLTDFKRHPWLHFISISTISVALIILGGFFIAYRNFSNVAEKSGPQLTGTLYLREGLAESQIEDLKRRVTAFEGVEGAEFRSRHAVISDLQSFLGSAGVDSLPGSELFPDVVELQIKSDLSSAEFTAIKNKVSELEQVSEADFSEDWLVQYKKIRQMLQIFGILLLMAILAGCTFIIANFMGMRHQSRKNEIEIVRLVGAQGNFIFAPFLWEAIIEGLIGSMVALVFLFIVKTVLSTILSVQWASLLGVKEWLYLSAFQFIGLILFGLVMAFCGSLTVFMRFRENAA